MKNSPPIRLLLILALLGFHSISVAAPTSDAPSQVFLIQGEHATSAVVTAPWVKDLPTDSPIPSSEMIRAIAGIAAVLEPRQIRALEDAVAASTRLREDIGIIQPLWAIHLSSRTGQSTVQIGRVQHGWLIAESDAGSARIETDAFDRLSEQWIPPRPRPIDPQVLKNGADEAGLARVSAPPAASPIRLDGSTLNERFARGRQANFSAPLTRTITEETFSLWIPEGTAPDRPHGLVVWINPMPESEPPPGLAAAVAKFGMALVIPANAGNNRPIVDRLQIALDAVQSASRTIWIDQQRIFIAGLSGGGRAASMLWAGAPDVFAGALCIAGINSHHQIPTGEGNAWPASHERPGGKLGQLLSGHPIAAMSGIRDFNFEESRERIRALKREGYEARLFDIANMGHEMPPEESLLRALQWVDQPIANSRAESAVLAERLLQRLPPDVFSNQTDALSVLERRALERITQVAPWTEPAWAATRRLGFD